MNATELLKQTVIEATNDYCSRNNIAPVYRVNPIQKHTTYLDLGVLGDEVEAVVSWQFDADQEDMRAEIMQIKISMPHTFHGRDVYGDLPERVVRDILHDIESGWAQ
jgi:hypothetical protein